MPELPESYETTCTTLFERIMALIPEHPEILDIAGPFGLFEIPGFDCSDLEPSLAQASAALSAAKNTYRREHP